MTVVIVQTYLGYGKVLFAKLFARAKSAEFPALFQKREPFLLLLSVMKEEG